MTVAGEPGAAWRLLGHVAVNRVYQQGVMLAILVITARLLGPEGRGSLATAVAWVQLGGTVAALSLGKIAFQQGTIETEKWSGSLLATIWAAFAISYGTLLVVAAAIEFSSEGLLFGELPIALLVLAAVTIPFFVWEDFAFYFFAARSDLLRNYRIVSVGRTISVVLVILLVASLGWGSAGAMFALLIGQATSSAWTLSIAHQHVSGSFRTNTALLQDVFTKALRLHPMTIATATFGAVDIVLLHAMQGGEAAGFYQAAWALMAIPVFASTAVGNVLYQLIAERGADGAWPEQKKLMLFALAVAGAVSAVAIVAASVVVTAIFGDRFQASGAILIGLLPFGLAQIFSNLLMPQWVARGWFATCTAATCAIAACAAILNYFAVPTLGVWGPVYVSWVSAGAWITLNASLALWIERQRIYRA